VHKVRKVLKEDRVTKGHKVQKVLRVLKVLKEDRVTKGHKVL
jgi:hypothetical protein